ncbi:hypothetical protein N7453_009347 [Penicillium expansum]|nr:hypothetical protein N7453_009347 [Penicillium expansum]
MRKSRQTSKTTNVEIQNDSKWVNNRVWAKEVQFDPRGREGGRGQEYGVAYAVLRASSASGPNHGPRGQAACAKTKKKGQEKDPVSP